MSSARSPNRSGARGRPRRHRGPRHERSRGDLRPVRAGCPARAVGRASGRRRSSRCTAPSRGSIGRWWSASASRVPRPTWSRSSRPVAAGRPDPRHHERSVVSTGRAAETCIDLGAGPELAIAATKTYTTELLAIAALSAAMSGDPADAAALVAVPDAWRRPRAGAGRRVDGARSGLGGSAARARAWVRIRHRPRVGTQAQGAGAGLRRPVLGRRLRARTAGPARAGRAGAGDGPAGRPSRHSWRCWNGCETSMPMSLRSRSVRCAGPGALAVRARARDAGMARADRVDRDRPAPRSTWHGHEGWTRSGRAT